MFQVKHILGTQFAVGFGRMRLFWETAVQDMRAGRDSWRVIAVTSGGALAASALYFWW